ncbi:MAG: hypothetical protein JWN73_35 [Betaproteobacteria bacterium]|nr:hypothetical protein [Betaproteobacteria bacterium]
MDPRFEIPLLLFAAAAALIAFAYVLMRASETFDKYRAKLKTKNKH